MKIQTTGPGEIIYSREGDGVLGITITAENNAMKTTVTVKTLLQNLRELGFIK